MTLDTLPTIPPILQKLAQSLGTAVINRRLEIPERFGKGYCTGFVFNRFIRMLISNYELNEEWAVENPEMDASKRWLFFKFQNIFPSSQMEQRQSQPTELPSVLIATSRMNTDEFISIHTNTATINIEVDADYLNEVLEISPESAVLQSLVQNTQPLLFEQMINPSLQKIVDQILSGAMDKTFELFFLRIKAEELICQLLMDLKKRDEKQLYALNPQDLQIIYKVKEQMLAQLESPPIINKLALFANMSPSKLKRLFKQIFGDSIFNYYQQFRMQEAARLLKVEKLSVSEAGYRLGFTNLSHFSRVFRQHIGMKPKQYRQSSHLM